MANPTAGFGLRAVRRLDGAMLNLQMEARQIAYNESSVMAQGDLVKSLATGYIDLFDASDTRSAGVFMGCSYLSPEVGYTIWTPYWSAPTLASTTIVTAWIILDPMVVFEIRTLGSAAVGVADINANADISYVAPNATTGQSLSLLDASTINTTNTLPLRIVALSERIGNDNTLQDNIVEVVLNTVDIRSTTGIHS